MTDRRTYPRTLADVIAANKAEHAEWVAAEHTDPSPGTNFIDVLDENGNVVSVDEEFDQGIIACTNLGCDLHFVPGLSGDGMPGLENRDALCNDCARWERP